jgi:hypothetical protein
MAHNYQQQQQPQSPHPNTPQPPRPPFSFDAVVATLGADNVPGAALAQPIFVTIGGIHDLLLRLIYEKCDVL